jgi:adenosylcobyric acid synthase
VLINRFRGRRELFDEGRRWLERHTGLPVLGVMPWLQDAFPPEDSLDLLERRGRKPNAELEITVLRLPSLSNFSDLDPLEAEATVRLTWRRPGEALGRPDAVILPGSKQTLADLSRLRQSGMAEELIAYVRGGGHLFGICGGLQMLGQRLLDPHGLEGAMAAGAAGDPREGLGLLPLETRFGAAKALRQRRERALWPGGGLMVEGFELHHGQSRCSASPLAEDPDLGWWQPVGDRGGLVAGTYLHGLFENGAWRRRWLNKLRLRRRLPPLDEDQPHQLQQREALLDRLAEAFRRHVDLAPLIDPPHDA